MFLLALAFKKLRSETVSSATSFIVNRILTQWEASKAIKDGILLKTEHRSTRLSLSWTLDKSELSKV